MNQNYKKELKKGPPRDKRTKQSIIDLMKHIHTKVAEVHPKEPKVVSGPDKYIQEMYWRSISLFEAIIVLLDRDLTEEALILARSLFEESLRLTELADAGKERTALILGWVNYSFEVKKGLIKEAVNAGLEQNPEEVINALEEKQKKVQAYARRHGVGPLKGFLSERNASFKFDCKDDYWNYLLCHQMVHGSDAAYIFRRKKLAKDTVGILARTSDVNIIGDVAFFAARSILHGTMSTVKIFNWDGMSELKELLDEVNNFSGFENGAGE